MKRKKKILPAMKFKYKDFITRLQAKLKSGKLTEQQKVKIFFLVKNEEIKNMTKKDLERAGKKYTRILASINKTIPYLELQRERARRARKQTKMLERVKTEKYAQRQCKQLILRIRAERKKR